METAEREVLADTHSKTQISRWAASPNQTGENAF
jgi:hypothetical protein